MVLDKEFMIQMNRITNCFGSKYFPMERIKLIKEETKDLGNFELARIVDYFVGNSKFAPTVEDFRKQKALLREQKNARLKAFNAQQAQDFWEGKYAPEEKTWIMENIRKRFRGEISDEDYSAFLKVVEHSAEEKS